MAPLLVRAPSADHLEHTNLHPGSNHAVLSTLKSSPHTFLQPPSGLHRASLDLAKCYLDPLATSTSHAQNQRLLITRRKRKRREGHGYGLQKPLQLQEIYVDGLKIQQVWEQARRVLDASRREAEDCLQRILQEQQNRDQSVRFPEKAPGKSVAVRFRDASENDPELDASHVEHMDIDGDKLGKDNGGMLETPDGLYIEDEEVQSDDVEQEDINEDENSADAFEGGEYPDEQSELGEEAKETFVPDRLGLNDGFFSIDDFNRQSEFLEHQDTRGENDGAATDEEDVDWEVDPLATVSAGAKREHLEDAVEEASENETEDGPTFGNYDLTGPDLAESDYDSESGMQMEGIEAMNNTNDIKYADFFAPPPRKVSKASRHQALPKTQPPPTAAVPRQETEEDVQRTIFAVRRDIFEDDLSPDEDAPDEGSDPRSSHQKRQAALTTEIRRLEAAALAKRDWTLSGEARAADRPINSLLQEDLDFERAGKPIPVITQEVSEDIEALIKRRILAREFDEVIRRRPGDLATGGGDVRRGRFELEDTKPQQSLAEIYEAEHLKTVDPEGYTDKRDKKLKQEHANIEQMWKDVSAKLDALSSWHYKPKPPSASINVIVDVPTISMEDARPSGGGDANGESMLAPQEVYRAGEARNKKEEVVTGSGLPIGREELTRDEKTRRRRREKERIRKAGGLSLAKRGKEVGKETKEKQNIVGDLKKGGVRVIGKKGELKDIEGKTLTDKGAAGRGGGGYKL